MKSNIFKILSAGLLLISCAKNDGTSSPLQTPASPSPVNPGAPPSSPKENSVSGTCPFLELEGTYKATKVECSVDRKYDASQDFAVVPMEYVISSANPDRGLLTLKFIEPNGNSNSSIQFEFPRKPTSDDFNKNGTQCGNESTSKGLTQNCPGATDGCAYSFSEEDGKIIGVYYRFQKNTFYSCRSELSRFP